MMQELKVFQLSLKILMGSERKRKLNGLDQILCILEAEV